MANHSGERPTRALVGTRTDGDATSAILGALPSGDWTIFDRVALRGRRTPLQVVVGPQGVFVIESRRRPRPFSRDELCREGVRQDLVVRATRAALAVAAMTGLVEGRHVTPVVCFLGREVQPVVAGEVVVCSSRNLLAILTSRPEVLDAEARQLVALDLDTSIGRSRRHRRV